MRAEACGCARLVRAVSWPVGPGCGAARVRRRRRGRPGPGPQRAGRRPHRSSRRAIPVPAGSPAVAPRARGLRPGGALTTRRRVEQRVSGAARPGEVSHRAARRPPKTRPRAPPPPRIPDFVRRWTSTISRPRNSATGVCAATGVTPGSSIRQIEAVSRSASDPLRATTTSTTSRPGGSPASSAARTASGSRGASTPISRYSASLAAPVGAAPA